MTRWWVGNALLALALPIVLVEASNFIRSLAGMEETVDDVNGSRTRVGVS